MEKLADMTYRFGPFVLEPGERRLTRDGQPVKLTAKSLELLTLLVARAGQLVTKEEIFIQLWPDTEIEDSNLTQTVWMLRKCLEDNQGTEYIATIPKSGYRFVVSVHMDESKGETQPSPSIQRPTLVALRRVAFLGATILTIAVGFALALAYRHSVGAPDLYYRGLELEREGKDAQAREEYEAAIRKGSHADQARLRAAWLAYQDFDNDAALRYLQPLVTTQRTDRHLQRQAQAIEQMARAHLEDALLILRPEADNDPNNADLWYFIGDTAMDAGDLTEAENSLARCSALDPKDTLCAYDRLLLWVKINRFQDAIHGYQDAVRMGMRYPWFEEAAGYAELGMGNLEAARKHFDQLAELTRQDPHAYAFQSSRDGLAAIALYTGKITAARERIGAALQTSRSPYERASYQVMLAQIDALVGRSAEVQYEVQAAVAESSSGDIAMDAAGALAMSGDFRGAQRLLEQHTNESAELGRRYAATREFVRALEALNTNRRGVAIDLLSNSSAPDPFILHYQATAEMQQNNWRKASEILRQLLGRRGEILRGGVPILVPLSEYQLGLCERHLGQSHSGDARIKTVEQLWREADPEARHLVH